MTSELHPVRAHTRRGTRGVRKHERSITVVEPLSEFDASLERQDLLRNSLQSKLVDNELRDLLEQKLLIEQQKTDDLERRRREYEAWPRADMQNYLRAARELNKRVVV
jgi:hypothetical protein